jgi:hypothetical protein
MLRSSGIERRVVGTWTDVSEEHITCLGTYCTLVSSSADLPTWRRNWYIPPKHRFTYAYTALYHRWLQLWKVSLWGSKILQVESSLITHIKQMYCNIPNHDKLINLLFIFTMPVILKRFLKCWEGKMTMWHAGLPQGNDRKGNNYIQILQSNGSANKNVPYKLQYSFVVKEICSARSVHGCYKEDQLTVLVRCRQVRIPPP